MPDNEAFMFDTADPNIRLDVISKVRFFSFITSVQAHFLLKTSIVADNIPEHLLRWGREAAATKAKLASGPPEGLRLLMLLI